MNRPCLDWRRELEACLLGRVDLIALRALSMDPHAVHCASCRGLLEEEQALEYLLGSLPEPKWPSAKVHSLLARLRDELDVAADPLDRLLERDATPPQVPSGVAGRVLAGLASERQRSRSDLELDDLLDHLPDPVIPAGLEERVLAAVAQERLAPSGSPRLISGLPLAFAAAAVIIFALALSFFGASDPEQMLEVAGGEPGVELPRDELLAVLGVLENWDLLVEDELDVLLSSVGAIDELLLEVDGFEGTELPTHSEPSHG